MKVGVLFSGGKDSVYSLYKAMKEHEVVVLITLKPLNPESYMFHYPSIEVTKLQAEAIGIPQIFKTTKGEKEKELEDLKEAIKEAKEKYGIEGLVSGAIASTYQKSRIDKICEELGLESIAPLWHKDPKTLLLDILGAGFKIIITGVAAGGLEKDWLGKEIDLFAFKQLCDLHNTCYICTAGEGGEFETLVIDGPIFKKRIKIEEAETVWDGSSGMFLIKKARLEDKD